MSSEALCSDSQRMTPEQESAWWAEQQEAYQRDVEREERRLAALKAVDHHTKCRDCGVFVDKSRWVNKESYGAINRGERPLCNSCWSEYDYDY